jgi:hypothetical protein
MTKSRLLLAWTCAFGALASAMAGCLERESARIGPEIGFAQEVSIGGAAADVDILFVIDNSGSMSEEQANLSIQIPALVRALASPPDRDADGAPDWNSAERMRIGIVTTDTGIGSIDITASRCVPNGEDGRLRGLFEWSAGDDPQAFAEQVEGTVGALGITGCNFEQPLEAAARAIAHAPETGFPAPDRLFALVVVSDEEDCSVDDDDAFFGTITDGTLNVHCSRNTELLTPLPELLARIRGDRAQDDFLFAAITGIPRTFGTDALASDILAHPDMQYRESGSPPRLVPACAFTNAENVDLGEAYPARRAVELASMLPDSVVTTICTDDFAPAITEIADRIGARVGGVCLARALPTEGSGTPCEVSVLLPSGDSCASFGGYSFLATEDGRERCAIAQVAEGSAESGFFYDPERDGCPQLVLTPDAVPPAGAALEAECFFSVLAPDGEPCARGSQCASSYCDPLQDRCAPLPTDDPVLGT